MPFRSRLIALLLIVLIFSAPATAATPSSTDGWETIVPGIEYAEFQLPDPNNVFVARMDRANLSLTLESTLAQGKLSDGKETVSSMYARYDQALSYWGGSANPPTWGMRNQVIVGINGGYYDWYTGMLQGGQVQSGWYAKRYDDFGGWSGFAWKLDRTAFIGECIFNRPEKQLIYYPSTGYTQQITKINAERGTNELVMYTPQYNTRTGTADSGAEVLVEMSRPTMILPSPANASGTVRQIHNGTGNSLIPFNSIVLSATGTAAQALLANVQLGSEVRVSQELTSYEYDCETQNALSWTKTYAAIQGAYFFLENGQIREFFDDGAIYPDPRTAIAYNDQYVYFIVVDGRDSAHSVGMTILQLAQFTRDTLDAISGVAEDGGGSSTMVIDGVVMNDTYCNIYICNGDYHAYLPIAFHSAHQGQQASLSESDIVFSTAGVERMVANGMLMVIAQPAGYSNTFSPGEAVTTVSQADIRLGPGTNYDSFSTIPAGSNGTVLTQVNGLDGVYAKGSYWWYVSIAGVAGWLPENVLSAR